MNTSNTDTQTQQTDDDEPKISGFLQLVKSLEKIADALQHQSMPDRLWEVSDLANYFGYHENFIYTLKDKPGFPRPVSIGKHPRWIPSEIKDWAKKQRG